MIDIMELRTLAREIGTTIVALNLMTTDLGC